jgi:hypothetical protein
MVQKHPKKHEKWTKKMDEMRGGGGIKIFKDFFENFLLYFIFYNIN